MLIRFRVENHRSIRTEQELSFVASPLAELPESVIRTTHKDINLLRVIGIYGANASGKSTVLEALDFMQKAVRYSHTRWKPEGGVPRSPFLLDPKVSAKPTSFEVDFILSGSRYTYGFVINSKRVLEEWLYAYPRGRKQKWFTRDAAESPEFNFSRLLPGENKTIQSLTRDNSLFLSAAAQNNHSKLRPIFEWFSTSIRFVGDNDRSIPSVTLANINKPEYQAGITSLILSSDLGISGINIEQEQVPDNVKRMMEIALGDNPEKVERMLKVQPTIPRVLLTHKTATNSEDALIDFSNESRGTQALFGLAGPIVITLAQGGLLCIDELDSSLHPLVAVEIVQMFNNPKSNPRNAQLLFNTHDTNIIECGFLRRDEIWFTEKDSTGATTLYPLTDYKARKEENLKRGYLQGRYGAVPFIETKPLFTAKDGDDEKG